MITSGGSGMGNVSGTVRVAAGEHPARAARSVRATAGRALGQGPAASLLSLALTVVVGGASLGVLNAASSPAPGPEPERPRVTLRAELPERRQTARLTPQVIAPRPEPNLLTVYIVSTEEEAEWFQTRIDEENRTQDVLQRPQVQAVVLVSYTPDDLTHIHRALGGLDTLRRFSHQSTINIIDVPPV